MPVLYHKVGAVRYLPWRHTKDGRIGSVKLTYGADGLWRDRFGGIYAYAEQGAAVSDVKDNRCGIGVFSLPEGHPLNMGCQIHDFQTSSPAYQMYHTASESTQDLERNLYLAAGDNWWYRRMIPPMVHIADFFTKLRFWENKETNI